jgi:Glycosyl transferase family 2/Lysylphosphatidylglycerol synthase TM region
LLVTEADFGAVLARVGSVQFFGTLLATVLLWVQVALNAGRWLVLMRLAGGTLYYHQAFQIYLESMFFYQTLPLGVLGGDGFRVYRTVRLGSALRQAASSVLLDRLAGLLGLVLLIVVGLPMFYRMVEDVAARSVFATLIIAGLGGAVALVCLPWLPVRWHRHYLISVLVGFAGLVARMLRERKYLAPTLALTVAGHSSSIVAAWLLAESLSLPIRLLDCSMRRARRRDLTASVVIPCRNECGNIENAIRQLPRFCDQIEVIFVEGHSSDGTYAECQRIAEAYGNDWAISVLQQTGKGKGDAVRKGFDEASGDVLMILDADLTVPPKELSKFYEAIASGKGEFINGTRLVYPVQEGAMRVLNYWANRTFALIFSFLLNMRFTDTLCGTKVLTKLSYQMIKADRKYFGEFDPFGDYDLIFGAAKNNLKCIEVPVRYRDRSYGDPQISRFRDGWLLLRMVMFAWRKLKAI